MTETEESSQSSLDSPEGSNEGNSTIPNQPESLKRAHTLLESRPARTGSLSKVASTSRVPEVVIYSPKRPSSINKPEGVSREEKHIPKASTFSSPPPQGTANVDLKGKGRMSEQDEDVSPSSDSDSDAVLVATKASDADLIHYRQESPEELPNSDALSTPRKRTKRRLSLSPDSSPTFQSIEKGDKSISSYRKGDRRSAPAPMAGKEEHLQPKGKVRPALKAQNSMEDLFHDLINDPDSNNVPEVLPSESHTRTSLLSQMVARSSDNDVTRPGLCKTHMQSFLLRYC